MVSTQRPAGPPTNMQFIRRSSKKPVPGDVFAMLYPDGQYLFGRVIRVDLPEGKAPMTGANLLYIYNVRSDSKDVDLSLLRPEALLIPPVFTNRMLWSKGFAETIASPGLQPDDELAQYCFRDFSYQLYERYFDEEGNEISGRREPCGVYALDSYRTLDDSISEALGIPLIPPQPGDHDYVGDVPAP